MPLRDCQPLINRNTQETIRNWQIQDFQGLGAQTHYLAKTCLKLYENEENWTGGGMLSKKDQSQLPGSEWQRHV